MTFENLVEEIQGCHEEVYENVVEPKSFLLWLPEFQLLHVHTGMESLGFVPDRSTDWD